MLGLSESKKVGVVGIPGVGKTTVVSKVVEKLNALNKSVSVHSFGSVTNRLPTSDELEAILIYLNKDNIPQA